MDRSTFNTFYEIPCIPFDFEDNIKNIEILFLLLKLNNPDNSTIIEIEEEAFRQKKSFCPIERTLSSHSVCIHSLMVDMFYWVRAKKGPGYWSEKRPDEVLVNKYKWKDAVNKYLGKNLEIVKIIL
jgi:hypothetical protein